MIAEPARPLSLAYRLSPARHQAYSVSLPGSIGANLPSLQTYQTKVS